MRSLRSLVAATLLAAATLMPADRVDAVTLTPDDVGTGFTVDFDYVGVLRAQFDWVLTSVEKGVWTFKVAIANLSSSTPDANRLVSFGFATSPDATKIKILDDGDDWEGVGYDPKAGFQTFGIEACLYAGKNCQGGSKDGLKGGETSSVTFSLTPKPATGSLTFDAFGVRYQSIDIRGRDSIAFEGFVRETPPSPVPLPAAGLMLLAGLGGLVLMRRRPA